MTLDRITGPSSARARNPGYTRLTVTVFVDRTVFVVVENTVEKRVAHCWAISNPFFPSPSP